MRRLALDGGGWTVRAVGDGAPVPGPLRGREIPATVPGCVHTDLLRAGLIPDPLVEFNEREVQWIGECDWEFRRRFTADAGLIGYERIDLACEGLDTIAEVSVNGAAVGAAANMFHPHRFDLRGAIREGENEVAVVFRSPLRHIRAEERRLGARPVNGDWEPYVFIRKAACHFGWDWAPRLATAGIWKSIGIEAWSGARLAEIRPLVRVIDRAARRWAVEAHARVEWGGAVNSGRWTVDLEVRDGDRVVGRAARGVAVGEGRAVATVEVDDPRLWWPRGLGGQPLYDVDVVLASADHEAGRQQRTGRIGFREVRLDTSADEWGSRFQVEVNGKAVFCRGANWVPEGAYAAAVGAETIRERVLAAAAMEMNMLRVWGGGYYERDEFYRVCDEQGIMVWQDFMFACAMYPEEAPYPALVEAEARHQVSRLAAHPSVVLWCGGNECAWAHEDWGAAEGRAWKDRLEGRTWGAGYYFDLLPRVVREVDPTRPYWPNSPWSGGAAPANDANHGDRHTWDARGDEYRRIVPRFCSEFGHQAPANRATLARAVGEAGLGLGSRALEHRQRGTGGMTKHIDEAIAEVFRAPRTFDEWHYLAQVAQARSLRTGIEWMRAHRGRCMGALVWQLNDAWAGMSWSLIDAAGGWKPAAHAVKEAMGARHLAVQPLGGRPVAVAINDTDAAWTGEVVARRVRFDGTELARSSLALRVEAWSAAPVLDLVQALGPPRDEAEELIVVESAGAGGADGRARRAWWFFRPDRELAYPRPEAEVVCERAADVGAQQRTRVRAVTMLRDVVLSVDRLGGDCAAGGPQVFTLLPGETAEVRWSGAARGPGEDGCLADRLSAPPVLWCANWFGAREHGGA
jgi:beta-mannosidase